MTTKVEKVVEKAAAEEAAAKEAATEKIVVTAPVTVTCKNASKAVISTSKGNLAPGETGVIPFGEWTALVTCGLELIESV